MLTFQTLLVSLAGDRTSDLQVSQANPAISLVREAGVRALLKDKKHMSRTLGLGFWFFKFSFKNGRRENWPILVKLGI